MIINIPTHSGYSITYYLAWLFILIFYRENLLNDERDKKFILKIFAFSSPFIMYMYKMGFKHSYVSSVYTWVIFGWVIYGYVKNMNLAFLYLLVVFYSEFYELPIYLYRIITYGMFFNMDFALIIINPEVIKNQEQVLYDGIEFLKTM